MVPARLRSTSEPEQQISTSSNRFVRMVSEREKRSSIEKKCGAKSAKTRLTARSGESVAFGQRFLDEQRQTF